jgi:hypothetical protein
MVFPDGEVLGYENVNMSTTQKRTTKKRAGTHHN